ncbi:MULTISPECIES: hypothetical protein [Haloferax]|uniref:Uncharacterized protein n=2 Tax=Haloferax TaxID=2251 RepID=A0A1H7VER0_HALLR|nr:MULTISPECIES: hypothetical protein [Haloferax]KTG17118.1 hypothetical protein AUR66_18530 [Haloferax profundi]SEM07761.1 hypothetical protein SAMN04488691_1227 [Haloferax larsenii]
MGDYTDRFAGLDEELAEVEDKDKGEEQESDTAESETTDTSEEVRDEVTVKDEDIESDVDSKEEDESLERESEVSKQPDIDGPEQESNQEVRPSTPGALEDSNPGFPFSESVQAQIYPRRTTHDEFEDFIQFDVKQALREYGIRNDEKREIHEAILQFVMDHPDAVADKVVELRER